MHEYGVDGDMVDVDSLISWYPAEFVIELASPAVLLTEAHARQYGAAVLRALHGAPSSGVTIIQDWTGAIEQHPAAQKIMQKIGVRIARQGSCTTFISVQPAEGVEHLRAERILKAGAAEILREDSSRLTTFSWRASMKPGRT